MLGLLGEKGGEDGLSPGGGHTPGLPKTSSAVRCHIWNVCKMEKSHLIPCVSEGSNVHIITYNFFLCCWFVVRAYGFVYLLAHLAQLNKIVLTLSFATFFSH
jgi:hypothetical protein